MSCGKQRYREFIRRSQIIFQQTIMKYCSKEIFEESMNDKKKLICDILSMNGKRKYAGLGTRNEIVMGVC